MVSPNQQPNPPINQSSLDIHVMPSRFRIASSAGRRAKIIGLFIIIGVLAVALTAAAFYLNYVLQNSKTQPLATANANQSALKNTIANQSPAKQSPANGSKNEANENLNVNRNLSVNANANLSAPAALSASLDSDADGLTDEEEKIYGAKIDNPDTDGDGYSDGAEVLNGYNPLGSGQLVDSDLAKVFVSLAYDYSVIYPADWTLEVAAAAGQEVSFTSSDGEFVKIFVQDNPQQFSALTWYLEQWPDLSADQLKPVKVNGLDGIWDLEGLTVYLAKADKLYVLAYNVGNKEEMDFKTTFRMMVDSFKLAD